MVDQEIRDIRAVIGEAVCQTSLRKEFQRFGTSVDGGKMLRGRLVLHLAQSNGLDRHTRYQLAAAVEMLHAASLLHDDVVDGGTRRRHAPALWVSEGTRKAVLIGDLMLSLALTILQRHAPQHLPTLVHTLRQMCEAQAEQEFSRHTHLNSWDDCVRIATNKTGSLFGVAATCAAGTDMQLADALNQAGRNLGTAYQLADDMLDAKASPTADGKSIGNDAESGKLTAVRAARTAGVTPQHYILDLLDRAEGLLTNYPSTQTRWREYVSTSIRPVIDQFTLVPV